MCRADLIALRSNTGEVKMVDMFNKQHPQQGTCVTVLDLKQRASKEFPKSGSSPSQVQLIVVNKPLDNDSAPLCRCGIKPESVVQMVRKVHGG